MAHLRCLTWRLSKAAAEAGEAATLMGLQLPAAVQVAGLLALLLTPLLIVLVTQTETDTVPD